MDNEELLHIVLKGLPREYHPLCLAICTRTEQLSFGELHALLHAEEKQLRDSIQSNKNSTITMAMFTSGGKKSQNSSQAQFYVNNSFNEQGRGRSNQSSQNSFHQGSNSQYQNQFTRSEGRPSC